MARILLLFHRAFSIESFNAWLRLQVGTVTNCCSLTLFHSYCFEKVIIHDLSGSCYFSPKAESISEQLIIILPITQLSMDDSA